MDTKRLEADLIPGVLTMVAGVATLGSVWFWRGSLPLPEAAARASGLTILYVGMAVFLWAARHLESSIGGLVAPQLDEVVMTGPFKYVRHPTYLGLAVAMVGLALASRSWVGLLMGVLVFLPLEIHRARLEERALDARFGELWREYTSRTGFMLPRLGGYAGKRGADGEV